jgi:hypothetical protein
VDKKHSLPKFLSMAVFLLVGGCGGGGSETKDLNAEPASANFSTIYALTTPEDWAEAIVDIAAGDYFGARTKEPDFRTYPCQVQLSRNGVILDEGVNITFGKIISAPAHLFSFKIDKSEENKNDKSKYKYTVRGSQLVGNFPALNADAAIINWDENQIFIDASFSDESNDINEPPLDCSVAAVKAGMVMNFGNLPSSPDVALVFGMLLHRHQIQLNCIAVDATLLNAASSSDSGRKIVSINESKQVVNIGGKDFSFVLPNATEVQILYSYPGVFNRDDAELSYLAKRNNGDDSISIVYAKNKGITLLNITSGRDTDKAYSITCM